jgi:arylsulfatase A
MTFAEMVSSMDDMVGRLVAALDRMGARKDTLIIFTTDNGTPSASYLYVNDKGKYIRPKTFSIRNGKVVPGGKGRLDDTGTRVPFIANWPGQIEPGSESSAMVDLTDLLPTFTDLAGIERDAMERDGISFAPILFGMERARERPWIYTDHRGKRCVRSLAWKLYDNGRLFDMKKDPLEKNPLPQEAKKRQRVELQAVLDEMTAP